MSSIALKLTTLFVRQIAKPIANILKAEAKEYALFKRICVGIAQNIHFLDHNLKVRLLGRKTTTTLRPLNEVKAIQNGAEILSEAFIFSVAASGVLYEANRQRLKEKNRRDAITDDIATLQDEIEFLKEILNKELKLKIDGYHVPKNYKPSVLKVDEQGNVVSSNNSHNGTETAHDKDPSKQEVVESIKKELIVLKKNEAKK